MKKEYLPNEIYFGYGVFNAGVVEGYYFTSLQAFKKVIENNEEKFYDIKNGKGPYKKYHSNIKDYFSIDEKKCLANIVPIEKINNQMNSTMINLYLLKYKLIIQQKEKREESKNYYTNKNSKR